MSSALRSVPFAGAARTAQRGAVLVIALIFLLLLTMLAIGASNRSLLQERMAGSLLNAQRAEMSAQTALRGAEWKLWSSAATVGALGCGSSLFPACTVFDPLNNAVMQTVMNFRTKPGWFADGSAEYNASAEYKGHGNAIDFTATAHGKLAKNPRYIVEDMGSVRPPDTGMMHESGATGPGSAGPGQLNLEMYRITARATGGNSNTVRVLESTFDAQTH